ncbi:hypothetical protein BST45_07050 [Mycobacterium shinjukuense]|nr:hypothetical protein BST45_07050 [Mycobacterium shinjukuense]
MVPRQPTSARSADPVSRCRRRHRPGDGPRGIPGGTAHRLQHWYETKLVADGTDLRTAHTLLRHANLNTTAIYIQVSTPTESRRLTGSSCPSSPSVRTNSENLQNGVRGD